MATYCTPTHDNVCALDIEKEMNPTVCQQVFFFFLPVRQVSAVNISDRTIFNFLYTVLGTIGLARGGVGDKCFNFLRLVWSR